MKKGELKKQVLEILEKAPQSRESDIILTSVLWVKFYKSHIREIDGEYYINLRSLQKVPQQDHIGRMRRKIQETRKDLSTKKDRIQQEMEWKEWATVDKLTPSY